MRMRVYRHADFKSNQIKSNLFIASGGEILDKPAWRLITNQLTTCMILASALDISEVRNDVTYTR